MNKLHHLIMRYLKSCGMLAGYTILLLGCQHGNKDVIDGYIEGELTYISSIVPGYLTNLAIYRGDDVKTGQLLFQLDPNPEQADLASAQAQLATAKEQFTDLSLGQRQTIIERLQADIQQAQAQFSLAKITLDRNKKLYDKKVVAKADLDAAEADYKAQKERVDGLKADLAEATLGARQHQLNAQEATVTRDNAQLQKQQWLVEQKDAHSLSDGRVFDTFYLRGEYVPAGSPVLALLTKENIKLLFYIPERQFSQIHYGDIVHFTCDGCGKKMYSAKVNYIANVAEYTPPIIYTEKTRDKLVFRVEAQVDQAIATQFNAGQPVEIVLDQHERGHTHDRAN